MLVIVGSSNAVNLTDGLDGLAIGCVIMVALTYAGFSYVSGHAKISEYLQILFLPGTGELTVFCSSVIGAGLGFLWFNAYPANIFMGDTGSMFIGLILASVTLIRSQHKSAAAAVLLVPITALAIPIYDTFMAVIRRLLKKGSIFRADKRHLHHRLLSTGLEQRQIILFMYLITLYLGIFAFLFVLIPKEFALMLLLLLALGLFMGSRVIGFVEKKARQIHRLELKRRKNEV